MRARFEPPFGRLLHLCRAVEPSISIVLTELGLPELVGLALGGTLDAILAPEPAAVSDLESFPVWAERLSAVTPSADRVGTALWLKTCAARPRILPDRQTLPGSVRQIEALLVSKGLDLRGDVTVATPATLSHLVAVGGGIGLLPASLTKAMSEVTIRRLRDPDAAVMTWLTVHRDDASPLLRSFVKLVEAVAAEPQSSDWE